MKKFLVVLLVLCFLLVLNPVYAEDCFLFEGTYVGAAIVTTPEGKQSRPFFIIVANKHITGFFAPENQNHSTGGSSFNLAGFNWTDFYTLSLAENNSISINYPNDTTLNGKAKLISVDGGSGSFNGFFHNNPNPLGDFLPGDFLNIGLDGGAIVKVAAGKDVVHAFGKINSAGQLVQVFPEKGKGPKVEISISGDTANLNIRTRRGSFTNTMKRFVVTSCNVATPSSTSSGGSSGSIFFTNFISALGNLKSAGIALDDINVRELLQSLNRENEFDVVNKRVHRFAGYLKKAAKDIKSGLHAPTFICQSILFSRLDALNEIFSRLCNTTGTANSKACEATNPGSTPQTEAAINKLMSAIDEIKSLVEVNDDQNDVPDICEKDKR